jgi:rhodanese-related sulfurtransferase
MKTSISATQLADLQTSGQAITIIDVRRKEDFDKAPQTFAGASWKNPAEVDQWSKALPTQQEVIIYCVRGGSVSQSVQQRLAEQGCSVRYVEGGLEALNTSPRGVTKDVESP